MGKRHLSQVRAIVGPEPDDSILQALLIVHKSNVAEAVRAFFEAQHASVGSKKGQAKSKRQSPPPKQVVVSAAKRRKVRGSSKSAAQSQKERHSTHQTGAVEPSFDEDDDGKGNNTSVEAVQDAEPSESVAKSQAPVPGSEASVDLTETREAGEHDAGQQLQQLLASFRRHSHVTQSKVLGKKRKACHDCGSLRWQRGDDVFIIEQRRWRTHLCRTCFLRRALQPSPKTPPEDPIDAPSPSQLRLLPSHQPTQRPAPSSALAALERPDRGGSGESAMGAGGKAEGGAGGSEEGEGGGAEAATSLTPYAVSDAVPEAGAGLQQSRPPSAQTQAQVEEETEAAGAPRHGGSGSVGSLPRSVGHGAPLRPAASAGAAPSFKIPAPSPSTAPCPSPSSAPATAAAPSPLALRTPINSRRRLGGVGGGGALCLPPPPSPAFFSAPSPYPPRRRRPSSCTATTAPDPSTPLPLHTPVAPRPSSLATPLSSGPNTPAPSTPMASPSSSSSSAPASAASAPRRGPGATQDMQALILRNRREAQWRRQRSRNKAKLAALQRIAEGQASEEEMMHDAQMLFGPTAVAPTPPHHHSAERGGRGLRSTLGSRRPQAAAFRGNPPSSTSTPVGAIPNRIAFTSALQSFPPTTYNRITPAPNTLSSSRRLSSPSPSSLSNKQKIELMAELTKVNSLITKLQHSTPMKLPSNQFDNQQLKQLVDKWTVAAQEILQELVRRERGRGKPTTFIAAMQALGIPPAILRYNSQEDDFE